MFGWTRAVSFVNGRVLATDGEASSIRISSRVLSLGDAPSRGDTVVDLEGAFVLPGLVNAHDHLELNHYGALQMRPRYENAIDWIDEMAPALRNDPVIQAGRAWPLRERLFIGGLKNLLSGVTTVAHHNPMYRELGDQVPVRLLRSFRWAHSFALESRPVGAHGELGAGVRAACADTPPRVPFIVHACEGVDSRAEREFQRLESLGCLKPNTVLVHGVALSVEQWRQLVATGTSLIWCPRSNLSLFGRTIPARQFLDAHAEAGSHLCLASDSRITGSRDLLDEIAVARNAADVTPVELLRMVTTAPVGILRLGQAGRLALGGPADLVVLPSGAATPADALVAARRADVQLVVIGGRPLLGAHRYAAVFKARREASAPVIVDGNEKLLHARVALDLRRCPIVEPGVSLQGRGDSVT